MQRTCVECGSQVPESSRQGFCPKCLLKLAEGTTVVLPPAPGPNGRGAAAPARTVGDYELLELLGEGGMGVVFKAVQKRLNRTVALKMLRAGSLATPVERQRFQTEAQAVARLKHPNIVSVHEIGEHDGRPFFSMDYIEGRTLAEVVGRTPLAPERAARYARLIAQAVQHAHDRGVLHRDLKPGNVLLDGNDQPHVTDFGLAKELSGAPGITRSDIILGTPSYMSPEQAAGKTKQIQERSDVYSLGAILYDLLTARPPFRADNPKETLRQVQEQEPARVRLLNAGVPRDLETICLKCLAKEPEGRYESAAELADDLGNFLRGEPIKARRPGSLEQAYRWGKRHPMLSALGLAAGIMVVLLTRFGVGSAQDARASLGIAPRAAHELELTLERIGETVREVAGDPGFVRFVRTNQTTITGWFQLDRTNNPVLTNLLHLKNERPSLVTFKNWLVLGKKGQVLGNSSQDTNAKPLPIMSGRDYFRVVSSTNFTNAFYIGKGYKSLSDERFKVPVITPIRQNGKFIGALAVMVTQGELPVQTARTKTAVIALMDPTSEGISSNRYAVLWSPGLDEKYVGLIPDDSELRRTLDGLMAGTGKAKLESYQDPVDPSGRWVASLDRVGDTPLIHVYQIRDRVWEAKLTGLILFIPCAVALVFWIVRRRREDRRAMQES